MRPVVCRAAEPVSTPAAATPSTAAAGVRGLHASARQSAVVGNNISEATQTRVKGGKYPIIEHGTPR